MSAKFVSILIYMIACVLSLSVLPSCSSDEVIKIEIDKETGVYSIPAKVNGLNLNFIFDTGASDVCISMTEAVFMAKNGYLAEDDIEGTSFAQLADGSVSENTKIKLKTIEVGGIKIHDISALVVHNIEAPLLLGQSAIRKLGRIEFDGDFLYIHPNPNNRENKIISDKDMEKYQHHLDSLVILCYDLWQDKDYILSYKHIKEARQMAYNYGISNRNWELDYIDSQIKEQNAIDWKDGLKASMPLLYSAFHGNEEKIDGVAVPLTELLENYANELSYHRSPSGLDLSYEDMRDEEEFMDVISLLMEMPDKKYDAYITSSIYYSKNQTVSIQYLEKAIKCDSTRCGAFYRLGNFYNYKEYPNKEKAIEYYYKALKTNDCDSLIIYLNLEDCYPAGSEGYYDNLKKLARLGSE